MKTIKFLRALVASVVVTLGITTSTAVSAAAQISASPASPVLFGNKTVGSTNAQVFTISSLTPAAAVRITGITPPAVGSGFTITGGTCSPGLVLTTTPCTLAVSFTPTAVRSYSGVLQVATGAPGTPLIIELSGSGIAAVLPSISVTPTSLNFGSIVAGSQSAVRVFTFRNTSTVNATISSVRATLSAPGSFIDAGDNCNNATLAPNQTCIVQVRFTPTAVGSYSGVVGVTAIGIAGVAAQGSVSGTATLPPLVPPILAPSAVTFPSTTVGASATPRVLTLSNPNPQSITTVVATTGAGFTQTTTCGATLAANASCTITVSFRPTVAGNPTGAVSATTSAGNVSATLSGTAVAPPAPPPPVVIVAPTLSPAAINFGSIIVGVPSRPQTATLSNPNSTAMTVTTLTSSVGFAQTNTCGASLAAGASCVISITFTPTAIGNATGSLSVTTPQGNASTALTGAGAPVPMLPPEATPDKLSFASFTVGTTSPAQTITVKNPNTQAITLAGFNADSTFSVSPGTCAASLAAGQSCTYSVVFKPTVVGAANSTLTLTSNVGTDTVTVSGIGLAVVVVPPPPPPPVVVLAPLALSLSNWDFGSVTLGAQSTSRSFTLTNSNASAISPLQISVSAGFSQSNTCGLSLAAGASCQINVQFTASSLGAVSGSLDVSVAGGADAAALAASAVLKGLGVAAAPVVVVVPSGSVFAASPRFMQASISAATSQFITYSFTPGNPRVTVADGIFCTTLMIPVPTTGATASYPCAANSEFARHPTDRTTFQTVQQNGSVVRATETIRIPSAVTRAAQSLGASTFYFLRRFDPQGFAVVEIRATGAIMNAPIALNDVRLAFETSQGPQPLVFVARGAVLPPVSATLFYTGSGVLRGRWELVQPGDVAPTERDLLPEASLPRSERGTQRRYQLLQRFEQLLPGNGRAEIKLPSLNAALGATAFDGQYQLLLRIEAEPSIYGGESGAANFAMPLLRYFVGSITAPPARIAPITAQLSFNGAKPTFSWSPVPQARYYRVEVADRSNIVIYSAIVRDTERSYNALSGFTAASGSLWRVQALDEALQAVGESPWTAFATK